MALGSGVSTFLGARRSSQDVTPLHTFTQQQQTAEQLTRPLLRSLTAKPICTCSILQKSLLLYNVVVAATVVVVAVVVILHMKKN